MRDFFGAVATALILLSASIANGYEQIDPASYFGGTQHEVAICIGSSGRGCIAMDGRYTMPSGMVVQSGHIRAMDRQQDAIFIHHPGMPEDCCWHKPATFAPGKDFVALRNLLRGRYNDSTIFGWNVIISQPNFNESVALIERHQLWPRCFAKLDAEPSGGGILESPKIECSFMHDGADWMQQTIPSIRSCPKSGGPYQFAGKDYVCINWWNSAGVYR
jgi:hypothetical protein